MGPTKTMANMYKVGLATYKFKNTACISVEICVGIITSTQALINKKVNMPNIQIIGTEKNTIQLNLSKRSELRSFFLARYMKIGIDTNGILTKLKILIINGVFAIEYVSPTNSISTNIQAKIIPVLFEYFLKSFIFTFSPQFN